MTIGRHEIYVRVVGDPYIARARAYKAALILAEETWSKFARDRGATHYSGMHYLETLTFVNSAARPKGWGRPNRNGRSRPLPTKEGKAESVEIHKLPQKPNPWDVFPEKEVPFQLNWRESKKSYGGGGFTNRWAPIVLWAGGAFYGLIPDVASAAREFLTAHPKGSVEDGAEIWTIPAGLERISEARYEYEVAQYRLEREEAEK